VTQGSDVHVFIVFSSDTSGFSYPHIRCDEITGRKNIVMKIILNYQLKYSEGNK